MTKFQTVDQQFAALMAHPAVPPRLAASLLLVRDGADGLEILMAVRAAAVDFASGAMVFPGGKVSDGDMPDALAETLMAAPGLAPTEIALRVSALREAYEEIGILPALSALGVPPTDADIAPIDALRADVDRGRMPFATVLRQARLQLDVQPMVAFAHLITPEMSPKRFDTWFYLAEAPSAQTPRPDGSEIVSAIWLRPAEALRRGQTGAALIILPTRLVLQRLASYACVADAFADARQTPPGMVMPRPAIRDGVLGLESPAVAGFSATWETMAELSGGRRLAFAPPQTSGASGAGTPGAQASHE